MALSPGVVDVFIRAFDQVPGDRSGPTGRLTSLKQGIAEHYNPGRGQPQRIVVKQRAGFASLTTNAHNSMTGVTESISWSNPELLSALGSQMLSVANSIPRVYDGTDWTNYGDERVVTNQLSQDVWHTSQRTINVPDEAVNAGVTCSVWVERINPDNSTGVVYVGFRSSDGTWVRTPQVLYDPRVHVDNVIALGKCVADMDGLHFWVIYNSISSSVDKLTAVLFDLNGKQLDTDTINRVQDVWSKHAMWDIVPISDGGCYLAQPLHAIASAIDGVRFTAFTQAAGSISSVTTDNSSIHCRGPLAWLTNDLGDDNYYLATFGDSDGDTTRLWAYQISPPSPNPFAHEYDFNVNADASTTVDSLIGYAFDSGTPDEPSVLVSFTSLQNSAATVGPLWDPQLRYSESWTCDWGDSEIFQRKNDYTCQVSRAFKHDDEYYSINYYQSGSGNLRSSESITVDFTAGDYMIGAKEQKVAVTPSLDGTYGATKTFPVAASGQTIFTSQAQGSFGITAGDKVESVSVNLHTLGARDLLKWTFGSLSISDNCTGGRLVIASSSGVTGANGTWEIVGADPSNPTNGFLYTTPINVNGGTLLPGTFGTAGTAIVSSMTEYRIPNLGTAYDNVTKDFLPAGTAVITGNATGANNGTKTIQRACVGWSVDFDPYGLGPGVWITTGSESSSNGTYTAAISPALVNDWKFSAVNFDDALLIGPHKLIVENSASAVEAQTFNAGLINTSTPFNNDAPLGYGITSIPSVHLVATDGTAVTAEVFMAPTPLPTVTIEVPDDVIPLTFYLQDLTVDYSLRNATLVVSSDTFDSDNNGTYTITDIDPDPTHHIVYCQPADGNSAQRSQLFYADDQSIVVLKNTNVQPEFQPCWLMVPLTGLKPVVGHWEYGLAYADWRNEGDTFFAPNLYPGAVSSPCLSTDDWQFMLPFRAVSFTVGQSVTTTSGQVINASISSNQSTIGLKQFTLSSSPGLASTVASEMLVPGPMCGAFTASGFREQGVNFGFEAPFIVSQQTSSNGVGLTKNGKYQVITVAEVTDENGDRVFSIPSPPVDFQMSGDANSVTYGGRLLQPLDTNGNPLSNANDLKFGVTNYKLLGISLYRTAIVDGVPTTDHHKITLDLNVNGLAPISGTNDSGFSFPDEFTWNYLDENLDAAVLPAEILYTDKGYLPRFPGPAQRQGVFWKDRQWVIGYDGAVWMSGEKKEGDATWFFPGFRFVLPTTDKPVCLAEMDDYLIVFCSKSIWYIPSAVFPDSTGRGGSLPAPIQWPFTNGCTGFAVTLREGVAYSSTAGGVWLITRGAENRWLSQQVQDSLGSIPITAMTVDGKQRLHVATGTQYIFVYDQVVQLWSQWGVPASNARLLTSLAGDAAFQEDNRVWLADQSLHADNFSGSAVAINLDLTLSSLNFSNIRGLKAVWEMQLVGAYKGAHRINAVISYPDDDPSNPTTFGPFTPDPTTPYLLAINPMVEQASSYGLRIYSDFTGISPPGASFELELVSCEVGVDSSSGINKFVSSRRIEGR